MIDAIVVTHNSAATIDACLASLREQDADVLITVVDAGSSDATVRLAADAGARVLERENRGFGASCNAGAALAQTETLLFVNPDAVLGTGCVRRLVTTIDAAEEAGERAIVCPAFDHVDPARDPGFRLALLSSELHLNRMMRPACESARCFPGLLHPQRFSGAAFALRRRDFRALGGFDERIFLYFEDTDLSIRASRSGMTLLVDPGATAAHLRGHSTSKREDLPEIQVRSSLWVLRKHRGLPGVLVGVVDVVAFTVGAILLDLLRGRVVRARQRARRLRGMRGLGR